MKEIKLLLFLVFLNTNFIISQKIYVNSIPKCGTHLLVKCIELLTNKKGKGFPTDIVKEKGFPYINENEFLFCHLGYSKLIKEQLLIKKYKKLFIYRDPRDQIISRAFWTLETESHYKKLGFNKKPKLNELIDLFIQRINIIYNKFLPWLYEKDVCVIKFENLIGHKGKGNIILQRNELQKICNFINIKANLNHCVKNLFGGTKTFRNGHIGGWQKHFSIEQKNRFKKIAGNLLIKLGYEKNLNW